MSDGYAINEVGNGGINVSTVHTTRRASIVNWLCVSKDMPITNAWTDAMIETAWRGLRGSNDYCIKVEISAVRSADANVTELSP